MTADPTALAEQIDRFCAHINSECENGCGSKVRHFLMEALQAASPGEWTSEKPTVEGWYWWRRTLSKRPFTVKIYVLELSVGHHGLYHSTWGDVCSMNGEWSSSPLTVPHERQK